VSTALAIFVKTPGLSPLKTRLAADIGASAAEQFHRLAAAAVADVARAVGDCLTPYWAVAERDALTPAHWPGFPRLWQGEGTLGDRLHTIYTALQARHRGVLLTGADVPQMTVDLLRQALDALQSASAPFVIGGAKDGGFWLFGGRQPLPAALWTGLRYSRTDTAAGLRRALAAHGTVTDVAALTDVDHAADLPALRAALAALGAPRPAQLHLRHWLTQLAATPQMAGPHHGVVIE